MYNAQQVFLLQRDANGNAQIDPNDPTRYLTKLENNLNGSTLPTLGIIIEW